jgi:hypothetical protein
VLPHRFDPHAEEKRMHAQIVMDVTGDTCHHFDATDCAAVMEAWKRFEALTKSG